MDNYMVEIMNLLETTENLQREFDLTNNTLPADVIVIDEAANYSPATMINLLDRPHPPMSSARRRRLRQQEATEVIDLCSPNSHIRPPGASSSNAAATNGNRKRPYIDHRILDLDDSTASNDNANTTTPGRLSCPICMGELQESVSTMCGHIFCRNCLQTWLKQKPQKCPLCKAGGAKVKFHPIYIQYN